MSAVVDVLHFADAGCPWDYSAEPVRLGLEQRYGEQLRWHTVQVGLHQSAASMARRGFTNTDLAESLHGFERFGMPFCTRAPARLSGTWAAGRLVKAAEPQGETTASALLRRLRIARFAEGRALDQPEELMKLAAQIEGLDVGRLAVNFNDPRSHAALRADMALARRPDRVAIALHKTAQPPGEPSPRFTTPTYVFSAHGQSATVPGFQPRAMYELALHNLAPELERLAPVDAAAFLRGHQGELFAGVEVAAATDSPPHIALAELRGLAASEPVEPTPVGANRLWSWGPPVIELRCGTASREHRPVAGELAA